MAKTVKALWRNRKLDLLEAYVKTLYKKHPKYIPAEVAQAFYEGVYLGRARDASIRISRICAYVKTNPSQFSAEFKDLIGGLDREYKEEVAMHEAKGRSEAELRANASAAKVRDVSEREFFLPITILSYCPAASITP